MRILCKCRLMPCYRNEDTEMDWVSQIKNVKKLLGRWFVIGSNQNTKFLLPLKYSLNFKEHIYTLPKFLRMLTMSVTHKLIQPFREHGLECNDIHVSLPTRPWLESKDCLIHGCIPGTWKKFLTEWTNLALCIKSL